MKVARTLSLKAALLGWMDVCMLLVPAYAQQEVDPTWYDPWAVASQPVKHQSNSNADGSIRTNERKVSSTSTDRRKGKQQVKQQVTTKPEHTQIATK